jgi:spoIIIJ-associated protein
MADIVEKEGPSVSEAVFAASMQLGIAESEAQVQVLATSAGGRVKVRVGRPGVAMPDAPTAPEQIAAVAAAAKTAHSKPGDYSPRASREQPSEEELQRVKGLLAELLEKMGTPSQIEVKERLDNKVLNVTGEYEGLLIGKRGMTLDALQEVAKRFLDVDGRGNKHVVVDIADYRGKHEDSLLAYAAQLGEQAEAEGQVTSKPLNPADRRVVHLSLKAGGKVDTWSVGDGAMKNVVVQKKD